MLETEYSNTKHTLYLVQNSEDLQAIQTDGKTVALNVETTGFDYNTDSVVGVSIAVLDGDRIVSYYIPLRHSKGHNIDTEPVFDLVQKDVLEITEITEEEFLDAANQSVFDCLKARCDKIESGDYILTKHGYENKHRVKIDTGFVLN